MLPHANSSSPNPTTKIHRILGICKPRSTKFSTEFSTVKEQIAATNIPVRNSNFRVCFITCLGVFFRIGDGTFEGCSSLKELTLGKGLKKIAAGAFTGCTALEKITIYATQPPATDGYIFSDATYENATLYVPQGSISKYQVMTGWSGFYNIIEMESGIENTELTHQNSPLIYDLHGRRVATPTKDGIYIVDGKKVMVKTGM